MAIFKNLASQKIAVFAYDTANDAPKTGDAANITAQISKDGGATAATNDTNPTELDATDAPGVYLFDMTQAETNADLIVLAATSSTSDISIEPVIIYTLPTWANTQVAQTGDSYDRLGAPAGASVSADIAAIEAQTDDIGAAGAGLTAIPWNAAWDAEVQSEVTDALNAYDPPTHAELISEVNDVQTDIAGLNDLSAADVNAQVDAALADYDPPTKAEMDAGFAALNDPTAAQIRAEIDSNSTQLAAILADTNELQTDDVPGLIAALNNLSAADVNAQVLDVLNTDSFAEPSGVPAAANTLAAKIGYLYMALRNQVDVTATKKTFYDDGGAAEWEKDLSDDGTTYSESEANAV